MIEFLGAIATILFLFACAFICWAGTRESREYRDEEKKTRYVIEKEDDR